MEESLFGKLAPVRLTEQVAAKIETFILGSKLHPGDKLPSERELASGFGVSRPVVREAIRLLEERGLLESRNGRGAFVTDPGCRTVTSSLSVAYSMQNCTPDHLYEARLAMEISNARLAAERATEADIARMELAIQVMDDHPDDLAGFMAGDTEFHEALAAATHNPLCVIMTRPLVEMILNLGHRAFAYGHIQERHQKHKMLLKCIRKRDASRAEKVMREHLRLSRVAFSSDESGDASVMSA